MNPAFDELDQEIKDARLREWLTMKGPRVGDFVEMLDGSLARFTHDWGDGLQTTCKTFPNGSFYFDGLHCSYSGALDPAISKERLVGTGREQEGAVWFFHHDRPRAYNGVQTTIPCRVYAVVN